MPEYSDDYPITVAKFSEKRFEIYVAGDKSIKIWDARSGKPVRILKNIFEGDITCMEFDEHHRKLIIGDSLGQLKVFDMLSGIMTHELQAHGKEGDGEISYIGYGGEDGTIVTIGWDKTIKVHRDERIEHRTVDENVLRGTPYTHSKDVISGDYAHYLGYIATGSRDKLVKVWDYERVQVQHTITAHRSEVSIVKFLKPF